MTRFWSKVRKSDGCWEWTATTDHRYGLFHLNGRMEKAHRVAYELTHGPIPSGLHALHSCDNTRCVRPSHLSLGTPADNAHDRDRRGRQVAPVGERSGMAKLTAEAVREIRRSADTSTALAARFGVTVAAVCYARTGKTWAHIR